MSGLWNAGGCASWLLVGLFVGWLLGLAHVAWVDSKRRWEQQQVEDAAREAVLAEGVANQARSEHEPAA